MANVYHANFRAASTRRHKRQGGFTFGAANDGAAAAIVAVLATACAAQNVSLVKRLVDHNIDADHPDGTRRSVKIWAKDADKSVERYALRNLKSGVSEDDIKALMTGAANTSLTRPVLALSTGPKVKIDPHDDYVTVSVLISDLD